MAELEPHADPPYLRIAAALRRRIAAGELRPGDPLPSTRQIVREFGVAMATATKVLSTLQQHGLARPVPGVGTVVDTAPTPASPKQRGKTVPLSRSRIVGTAIGVADGEGSAALSMRRIAADLGVTTMALYRHVSNREHLILLMADAVYGQFPLPQPPPPGWRRCLDRAARVQWSMYQHHPWLAQVTSLTRPLITPRVIAHGEWVMSALDGLGLDPVTAMHIHVTVAAHARGLALNLEPEAEAQAHSGITDEQWMDTHATPVLTGPASDKPTFPHLAHVPPRSLDLDTLFEFGLERLLTGIAALIDDAVRAEKHVRADQEAS